MIKQDRICPDCNKKFTSNRSLTNHIEKKICTKRKESKTCEKCGHTFTRKETYQYHKENINCVKELTVEKLMHEITDLKNMINRGMIINGNYIQTQNVENQTINVNNINVTILNYGQEGSISELIEKFNSEIKHIATNDVWNFIPLLSKSIHDGKKYPELRNIYSSHQYPDSVLIYKDGEFVKANKKKTYEEMIHRNKNILSQSEGVDIDEAHLDECIDYLDKIDGEENFQKKTMSDLDRVFRDIGKNIKNQKLCVPQ